MLVSADAFRRSQIDVTNLFDPGGYQRRGDSVSAQQERGTGAEEVSHLSSNSRQLFEVVSVEKSGFFRNKYARWVCLDGRSVPAATPEGCQVLQSWIGVPSATQTRSFAAASLRRGVGVSTGAFRTSRIPRSLSGAEMPTPHSSLAVKKNATPRLAIGVGPRLAAPSRRLGRLRWRGVPLAPVGRSVGRGDQALPSLRRPSVADHPLSPRQLEPMETSPIGSPLIAPAACEDQSQPTKAAGAPAVPPPPPPPTASQSTVLTLSLSSLQSSLLKSSSAHQEAEDLRPGPKGAADAAPLALRTRRSLSGGGGGLSKPPAQEQHEKDVRFFVLNCWTRSGKLLRGRKEGE